MKLNSLFENQIPVFLAPMAGVTDAPFRDLVCKLGVSAVVSEMISSEALVRNNQKTQKRLQNSSDVKIFQIMGSDPQKMADSAKINEDSGADIIDINMGCPAKKVVNNNSGASLLKDEKLAVSIAEAVVKSVKIPVTVKMRLGWSQESFITLAKALEDVGVRMLAIHCRTRSQMYSGSANWKAISVLRDMIKIPYLCNGDIRSPQDAIRALEESQADGIMVGRGALGRPWLLNQIMHFVNDRQEIPNPSLPEQYEIMMEHFHNTLSFYGEQGIRIFRKHFCWYSQGMSGAAAYREKINKINDQAELEKIVREFYFG